MTYKLQIFIFLFSIGAAALAFADDSQVSTSNSVPPSQNQVIVVTDKGIDPTNPEMTVSDSILFFLNSTTDSLVSLEVDFGDKPTHCASSNMIIEDAGTIKSVRPIGPRDFASLCFHQAGIYPARIYGLKNAPAGVTTSIVVK